MGIPVEVVAPTPPGVVVDVVFILSLPLPLWLVCAASKRFKFDGLDMQPNFFHFSPLVAAVSRVKFTLTTTTGDHLLPAKKISWEFFLLWALLSWAKLVTSSPASVLSKSILSANRWPNLTLHALAVLKHLRAPG